MNQAKGIEMFTTRKLICSFLLGTVVIAAMPVSANELDDAIAKAEAREKAEADAMHKLLPTEAEQKDADAKFNLGLTYFLQQNYAQAAQLYQQAAEYGSIAAEIHLAQMYVTGKGVPQNYVLAAQLYQQAAEQGNIEAQYSLAWLYKNGKGVPKNLATAEQWRQQATTVRVGAEQAIANINTRDTIALTPEQKQQKQAHDILD